MDIRNRRVTRTSSEALENQNVLRKAVTKDILKPTRRAFAEQRNTRVVATKPEAKRAEAVKPEAKKAEVLKPAARQVLPINHPEVSGIEREFSAVDFTEDVHNYLLSKEASYALAHDFMAGKNVTAKMRGILIDWLVQVHMRFHLFPETLHLTIYLIDCAITRMKVEKTELQLVGVAAMLLASKFEEMYVPDISEFELITDNAFSRRQIIRMELKVLQACDIQLSRPHSITFLRWLSKELGVTVRQHAMAKYLGEIALVDYSMTPFLPSQTAAISIYMAARMAGAEVGTNKMIQMIGWSLDEMKAGARVLAQAAIRLHSQEKLQALKTKFSSSKHSSVSSFKDDELAALQSL